MPTAIAELNKLYSGRARSEAPSACSCPAQAARGRCSPRRGRPQTGKKGLSLTQHTCQLPTNISITMKRQKKLIQTKITEANPEKEIDLTSLPEKELKIKLITMMMELQRNTQELRDEVWREITDARKEITEMKQTLEVFISRMDKRPLMEYKPENRNA